MTATEKVFDSVSALRGLDPSTIAAGDSILVTRYESSGDTFHQGCRYYYHTSAGTDNAGTIIDMSSGHCEMHHGASYDPRWFGCIGDNSRDDTVAFQRAVDAGCEVVMPPSDMFWGDRYAKVKDPSGHQWGLATHIEDVEPEECARRAAAWKPDSCG